MPDDHEAERSLEPGEVVTVAPALVDEMDEYLYVVIDGFSDPRYTLARLGGDGYQWAESVPATGIPALPKPPHPAGSRRASPSTST